MLVIGVAAAGQVAWCEDRVLVSVSTDAPVASRDALLAYTLTIKQESDAAEMMLADWPEPHVAAPSFDGARAIAGPKVEVDSTLSHDEGVVVTRRRTRYTWLLLPGSETLRIGEARVELDATILAGAGLTLPVTDRVAGPVPDGSEVHVLALLDHAAPFVGQPVLMTVWVLSGTAIEDVGYEDGLTLQGFRMERLEVPDGQWRLMVLGGRRYRALPVRRMVLYPLVAGPIEIPSSRWAVEASDGGAWQTPLHFERETGVSRLDVRPVPAHGRPDDWGGAVGRFSMSLVPPAAPATAGRPFELAIVIEGPGDLRGTSRVDLPPTYRAVGDLHTVDVSDERLWSRVELRYEVKPEVEGALTIPAVTWSYFDPWREAFASAATTPLSVAVGPPGDAPRLESGGPRLRGLKPRPEGVVAGGPRFWLRLEIAAGVLLLANILLALRVRGRGAMRARRRAASSLRRARSGVARAADQGGAGWGSVARALRGYLHDTLGTSPAATQRELLSELGARDLSETLRRDMISLLEAGDRGGFSPEGRTGAGLAEHCQSAALWLEELEREVRHARRAPPGQRTR